MLIIGIDPGLQHTGWGIISLKSNQLSFVACGVVHTNASSPMPGRLKHLHDGLQKIIDIYKPTEAAIEETFVNKNNASSLKLGQARGAILLSLALAELPIQEYSANMVKKSVVGSGHAAKEQIAAMVKMLLPTNDAKSPDAADALAIAICHAHSRSLRNL